MKKNEQIVDSLKLLRQKAKTILEKKSYSSEFPISEGDMLKLIQELEIRQIELELQNDELQKSKAREAELAKEKYVALYDFAPMGYFTLSRNGEIVQINLSAAAMLGQERSHLINKIFSLFVSTESKPIFSQFFNRLFSNKTKETCELALTNIDNIQKYVFLSGIASEDKNQFFITAADITERKLAEETQKESERKLRRQYEIFESLIKNLPMGIFMVEAPSGKPLVANETALNLLGRGILPDATKHNLAEVYKAFKNTSDEAYPVDEMPIIKGMKGESSSIDDMIVIRPDGRKSHLEIFGSPVKDDKGNIWASLVSFSDITKRKLSEAIFRDIIEKNPMSIQILNMEGYPVQINTAHTRLFGIKPPSDYSVFKDQQLLSQGFGKLFEQIKKGKVVYLPDTYYNVHDINPAFPDSPVWVKAVGFTLNDHYGAPERIVLMHENITERKHAEDLLNDIIEKNPMSIQIVDKEGHTLHGNPAYTRLFGGIPPPDFSIFEDLSSKSSELEKLVLLAKSGEVVHLPDISFNVHDVVPDAPDIPLWIRALIFPLNDSGGNPERFVFIHENITERKLVEKELMAAKLKAEENEVKYRQIFDNTFDIMAIYEVTEDRRFKVLTFNAAEAKLIGPVESYQNRYIDECIPPDLYDKFKQNYDRCIEAEKLIIYEEDISFGDIHKTFNTQLIPVKNNAGRIHRIIVISRDITENKLLQMQMIEQNNELRLLNIDLKHSKDQAEESDKLKSAFLANMSHEIRTPMNGILGFAELLSEPDLDNEKQQDYIQIIQKSGVRMLNIINDIVDISKIEAGLMLVNLTDSNINEQIEYMHTFFGPEAEKKQIRLSYRNSLPTKESTIKTDREKLFAILTNLLKNAIKYTEIGSIEFGYNHMESLNETNLSNQSFLQFFVKDTGIGIPIHRQEAIFERFIQADILDIHARQGAGLGLAISKAYIEMLGGKIWVESEEGKGSTFYFTLPTHVMQNGNEDHKKNVFSQVRENQISNLKILIVEDDEPSSNLISIIIQKLAKEIIYAQSGTEAVEVCKNNPDIDLVLMDIQLPEMDGYEATRQIRKFNSKVFIFAQTAFAQNGDEEKAIEAGCNDYISKPIQRDILIEKIQTHFAK